MVEAMRGSRVLLLEAVESINDISSRQSTPAEWLPRIRVIRHNLYELIEDIDARRRAAEEAEDDILSLYGPNDDIPGAA